MGKALAGVLGCALLLPLLAATVAGGIVAALLGAGPNVGGDSAGCAAQGGRTPAGAYGPDQVGNAAMIVAVGKQQQIPPRGWLVALAVALQESGLNNLDHGDRDSLGLFQQRPSTGWGSPAQIRDPAYSATQFYRHLQAIPGWEGKPVTEAAQAVQHSATPQAYAQHEANADRLLVAVGAASCAPTPSSF